MTNSSAHPFIIGERYVGRRGEYTVVGIDGNLLRIVYDDGTQAEGEIEIWARVYRNILAEYKALHPRQSDGYFCFLGFLSKQGDFQAEVPPQSRDGFEERYSLLTGQRPNQHSQGYYPIHIDTIWDKWAPELRIYFPETHSTFDLPPGVEVRAGHEATSVRINNNRFWWQLVGIGFRLGREHDVNRIRESIPSKNRPSFDAGMKMV